MSSLFNLASATVGGGHQARGGGYKMQRSVRLRSSASAYFNRTMAPAGVTVYTFSAWVKRGALGSIKPIVQGYLNNNNYGHIIFKADDTIEWREVSVAVNYGQVNTTAVFRDPSAWYHIVVVRNGTSLLIYVNGVSQTLTISTAVNAAAGYLFGGSTVQRIGSDQVNSAFFDGYLTECYLIDGQALTPLSFGETNPYTGVWRAKRYTGTYGTNGFYLNFSDNSAATAAAIGKDYSGLGNNWTPNNISVTAGVTYDSMLDVPTQWADAGNGRGNYAVLSPIDNNNGTLSSGNLNLSIPAGTASSAFGNFAMTVGKWYWEVTPTNGSVFSSLIGVSDQSAAATNRSYTTANGWGYYSNAQTYYNNTPASYGATFTTNDVIGVAYDADIGSLSFYKNGVSQGVAFSTNLFGKPIIPAFFNGTSSNAQTFVVNFGQRPFSYTPPSGFKALNTLNLPAPTILKGNQYFDTILWDGNGVNGRTITANVAAVDFAWVKKRNGIDDHRLANSVTGGNLHLKTNTTEAESTATTVIQAFSGSTFTVGSDNSVNASGGTYVGWTWKKGATQGFDIVTYTGTGANRTVSHNLGVAPSMIIIKVRTSGTAQNWMVGHTSIGWGSRLEGLNTTSAASASATTWNNTAPTSSVFSLGTEPNVNNNGWSFVAYLFSEVAGFSKFGSYTGNGSADGPFVFCGFRPRFILAKSATTAATNWFICDTARSPENVADEWLLPNGSNAEQVNAVFDILSNGFKLRNSAAEFNTNGSTYIFAAFAENPFKNALAR